MYVAVAKIVNGGGFSYLLRAPDKCAEFPGCRDLEEEENEKIHDDENYYTHGDLPNLSD